MKLKRKNKNKFFLNVSKKLGVFVENMLKCLGTNGVQSQFVGVQMGYKNKKW
jgi:hypothetical protein